MYVLALHSTTELICFKFASGCGAIFKPTRFYILLNYTSFTEKVMKPKHKDIQVTLMYVSLHLRRRSAIVGIISILSRTSSSLRKISVLRRIGSLRWSIILSKTFVLRRTAGLERISIRSRDYVRSNGVVFIITFIDSKAADRPCIAPAI